MRRHLEQWKSLTPAERRMLLGLLLLLPVIGAGLRLFGLKRSLDLLKRTSVASRSPQSAVRGDDRDNARPVARLVAIAARHGPYRASCLRRSLALWWLLRRRGIPAELRIGVRKEGGGLQAHAWVEAGRSPLGMDAFGYTPFPDLMGFPPDR